MRFGINLRGDPAKLDDVEIAARYQVLIAEKVAMHETRPPLIQSKWLRHFASVLHLREMKDVRDEIRRRVRRRPNGGNTASVTS